MYYGRKKGIIIGIIVAIVVILIAIIGLFLVMKTDLFKSNKNLFWKYMKSGLEKSEIIQSTQLEDIEKLKMQSPYIVNGELTASSTNEEISDILEKLKVSVEGQADKQNNYSHINTKLQYENNTIFNLEYANTDNIYALKSDEIVNAYVGVRNENLKVLLQKLGVENTSVIPDVIIPTNYAELFEISDEEFKNINDTYMDVILNNIAEDNYSRQTDAILEKDGISYNTTSYRLDLTSQEILNILTNILNTLKTDSLTLNMLTTKAKILGLNEEYTTISGINNLIDNAIEKLQQVEFVDTSFVVYSYKGENIATEILFRNTQKITIYNEKEKLKIISENLEGNSDYKTITMEILYKATSTNTNIVINLTADEEQMISMSIVNTGSATQGSLQTVYDVTYTKQGETTDLSYTQTLEFVNDLENIEKLDGTTNCAILNDYSEQDLNTLIQALVNQIVTVFNQKVQMISDLTNTNNPTLPEISM